MQMLAELKLAPIVLSALFSLPATSWAGSYVVLGAIVTGVTSTSNNTAPFTVNLSGGSGICAGGEIFFNQADSPDAATFTRAYVAALTALVTGLPVNIHNFQDSTCNHASLITVGPVA